MQKQWSFGYRIGLWAILITMVSPAVGQGLLDRLENRIRQRIEGTQPVPAPLPVPGAPVTGAPVTGAPVTGAPATGAPVPGAATVERQADRSPAAPRAGERVSLGLEAEERGFQAPYQIAVVGVRPGSPAAAAGLQIGDLIVAVDSQPVGTIDQIAVLVQAKQAGDLLRIDFRRGDRAVQATARLTAIPGRTVADQTAPGNGADTGLGELLPPPVATELLMDRPAEINPLDVAAVAEPTIDRPEPGSGRLGVTVENVATTPPEQGVPVKRGAVVVAVRPASPAEMAGIRNGNVIVAIDGYIIQDAAALIERISETRPGQRVELGVYQAEKLVRKPIVLADADGLAPVPAKSNPKIADATEPPASGGLIGGFGGAIGNLFGGANKPAQPTAELPARRDPPALGPQPLPPASSTEVETLKSEIQQLRAQLDSLQKRLNDLER